MPTPTYQEAKNKFFGTGYELRDYLARVISGKNPDGSTFSQSGGGVGVASSITIPITDDQIAIDLTSYLSGYTQFRAIANVANAYANDVVSLTVNTVGGTQLTTKQDTVGVGLYTPDTSAGTGNYPGLGIGTVSATSSGLNLAAGRISVPNVPMTLSAYTIEARVKRGVSTPVTSEQQIFNGPGFAIWLDATYGILGGHIQSNNTNKYLSAPAINDTLEHHVALVWDGTNVSIYKDGVLGQTDTSSTFAGTTGNLTVSANADNSQKLQSGTFRNLAVHTTARWSGNFTPSTSPTNDSNTRVLLAGTSTTYDDPVGRLVTDWTNIDPANPFINTVVENQTVTGGSTPARGVIDSLWLELRS